MSDMPAVQSSRVSFKSIVEILYLIVSGYVLYTAANLFLFVAKEADPSAGLVIMFIALPFMAWFVLSVVINPILIIRSIKRLRNWPALSSGHKVLNIIRILVYGTSAFAGGAILAINLLI